ncbi:MAG: hypothetical protein HY279_13155 [Nitrospinae bacterium]|nr:hypothetical protein [Nitrospinota bacterium]
MIKRDRVLRLVLAFLSVFLFVSPDWIMAEEPPKVEFKPKVGGYIEGWYRNDSSDLSAQTTAATKVNNEFRVRRARIDVKGNVSEEVGYRVNGAFDGPSPASGSATVKLWDGYITYKAHSFANFTLGQFKYPFTLEGLEGTPDRIPVLRAEAINDIASKLGTKGGSFRDIGIMLGGGSKEALGLKYGIAYINGNGINAGDNGNAKDVVGRVTISPIDGLTLGGSGYSGKAQDETASFEVNEGAYGAEMEFILKDMGISFRGEYVTAKWENWNVATAAAASGKNQEPKGWYFQGAYKLSAGLQLMARYEDYEKDSNTANSHLKTTTLGGTYYIKDKTRITANYVMRSPDNSSIVTAQETDAKGNKISNIFFVQMLVTY